MRRAARTDANQADIVRALLSIGCSVQNLSAVSVVSVVVPVRTVSASNSREHWAARARRVKAERQAAYACLLATIGPGHVVPVPCTIRLTRITPARGKALDDDNLRGAMKAARDGVADVFGLADNHPWLLWHYGQEKGRDWGVKIEIFA